MADVARADRLRALRKAHRLTQPDMAEIAGVTLRAYQAWESEKKPGGIDWRHATAIGRHFEVDPETLVRRRDEDPFLVEASEVRAQLDRIEQNQQEFLTRLEGIQASLATLSAANAAARPPRSRSRSAS